MSKITKQEAEVFVKCFGEAVCQMRELRGISRETVAKRAKVNLDLLARIEDGQVTGEEFGLSEICRLAEAMKITPYRLMQKCEQLIADANETRG